LLNNSIYCGQSKAGSFTDTLSVTPLAAPDSQYYLCATVIWKNPDTLSFFDTLKGDIVLMKDTTRPANNLQCSGVYIPNSDSVLITFGNAGSIFAKLAYDEGAKIIAVSDSKGAVINENGLDVDELIKHKEKNGCVADCKDSKNATNEEILELDCDVLVPAALDRVITKDNADKIKSKLILELANGPTTSKADRILDKKGVIVVPDVLANCGGVTVSYFEWVQNLNGLRWKLDRVNKELKEHITTAFLEIWQVAGKKKVSLRTAAYILAIKRMVKVLELRGVYKPGVCISVKR